jgi:hypothetical protein
MTTKTLAATALAILAVPATAGAAKPADQPVKAKNQNAPGQACKAEPKTKAAGQTKTAFAICVSGFKKQQAAEQKAAETSTKAPSPATTCKGQPKKKVAGQKKSAFASCVSGAAQARNDVEQTQS